MMRVLDLFSGIGGFSLGLERTGGFETVAFCEIDPFCRKVLAKHWPDVPIHEDVTKLRAEDVGPVDLICGGFPCQPWSVAGKQEGTRDDRDLWPEMRRCIGESRPRWVVAENVPGLDDSEFMGLDRVLSDLESLGYEAGTLEIPACAVNAPHRRSRLWIVANTHGQQRGADGRESDTGTDRRDNPAGGCTNVSNANQQRLERTEFFRVGDGFNERSCNPCSVIPDAIGSRQQGQGQPVNASNPATRRKGQATKPLNGGERSIWKLEPRVGRVANGIPRRVDRLRALGNAVVPQIPEMIGNAILEAECA